MYPVQVKRTGTTGNTRYCEVHYRLGHFRVKYWFVLKKSSAGKDGEPHLQDDIRREELVGECRDATEEEAEERPYPEDPSDWPAPHQITDTFRQNMTERAFEMS